jgi:hypothetical protein
MRYFIIRKKITLGLSIRTFWKFMSSHYELLVLSSSCYSKSEAQSHVNQECVETTLPVQYNFKHHLMQFFVCALVGWWVGWLVASWFLLHVKD